MKFTPFPETVVRPRARRTRTVVFENGRILQIGNVALGLSRRFERDYRHDIHSSGGADEARIRTARREKIRAIVDDGDSGDAYRMT